MNREEFLDSVALWNLVVGRQQVEASRLSAREATALDRRRKCVGGRADLIKLRAVLLDAIVSATGTIIVVMVSDVLGDRNAHPIDSEAEFRKQAEEVQGFAWGVIFCVIDATFSDSNLRFLRVLVVVVRSTLTSGAGVSHSARDDMLLKRRGAYLLERPACIVITILSDVSCFAAGGDGGISSCKLSKDGYVYFRVVV